MIAYPNGRFETLAVRERVTQMREMELAPPTRRTLYVRWGDWVVWASAAILVLAVAVGRPRAAESGNDTGESHES